MKNIIIVLICLFAVSGYCNYTSQQVVNVSCKNGVPETSVLSEYLNEGWKVVSSTPVMYVKISTNGSGNSQREEASHTSYIVYIIEKEIVETKKSKSINGLDIIKIYEKEY
jgi:streptogramin lyase